MCCLRNKLLKFIIPLFAILILSIQQISGSDDGENQQKNHKENHQQTQEQTQEQTQNQSTDENIEASSIKLLWKYAAGGRLLSRPAASTFGIFLYSEDRHLHALSPDGSLRWKLRISGRPSDSLSIGADGTAYVCNKDGVIHAVNPAGNILWRYDAGGGPAGEPAASADGTVYLGLTSGELFAFSHTGFLRWRINTGYRLTSPPVVDAGEAIYTFAPDGRISCWTQWGDLRWELSSKGPVTETEAGLPVDENQSSAELSSQAVFLNRPAAVDSHVLYTSCMGALQAVSPEGAELWRVPLRAECEAVIVIPGGLFCLLGDGRTEARDFNGALMWEGQGAGFSSYPAAGDKGIYILRGPKLTLMDFNGEILLDTEPIGISLMQPVLGQDLLVCGSEEWVACAFAAQSSLGDEWGQKGGGASHDGSSGVRKWSFNESDYLSNMDYLYLREFINSGDKKNMLKALSEIEERIAADGLDRGESYLMRLVHYAFTGNSKRINARGPNVLYDYPSVRTKAAGIMGKYGTFESIDILTSVLKEEKHQDVSAAIITALGALGSDYDGKSLWAIYNKVINDDNERVEKRLVFAGIDAVEKISAYSGVFSSSYGYKLLLEIYRGSFSASARRKAGEVLRSIR